MKNFLIQRTHAPYKIRLKNFVINFMLQRRNTYLFYSRKNFYWLSSHEWNYQTKKILKISSITILLKLKKKLKKYARNHNAKKDLLFFSLSLLSPLACFYLRRHSIFNLAWKILRFSILARCQILSSLLCTARDVRKWYKASSETRARRAKEHALEIDTLSLPVKEQVQRPAHAAFIAQRFETVHPSESDHFFLSLSFPSFFHDREHWSSTTHCFYRWYNPNGDIQRHARGVKFESYEE